MKFKICYSSNILSDYEAAACKNAHAKSFPAISGMPRLVQIVLPCPCYQKQRSRKSWLIEQEIRF